MANDRRPSAPWRAGGDPSALMEKQQSDREKSMAKLIADKFDECKWAERVAQLPKDWHEGVWQFLETERRRRALCRRT